MVVQIEQLRLPIAVAEPSAEKRERRQLCAFMVLVLLLELGWIAGLGALVVLLL